MENNEYAEIQVQPQQQDEQLERVLARSQKLREIAFDSKSQFIKDDKQSAIFDLVGTFVVMLLLIVGYNLLCSHSEIFDHSHVYEFLSSNSSLFYCLFGLIFASSLVHFICTLVIHGKLDLKNVLYEEVSTSSPRIKSFNKGVGIRNIVSGVFALIALIVFCVLVYSFFGCQPEATREKMAMIIAMLIAFATIMTLLDFFIVLFKIRQFSLKCEEFIKMLEV